MNIAKGSLGELFDSTDEAFEKQYLERSEYNVFNERIDQALGAAVELYKYLTGSPTPLPDPPVDDPSKNRPNTRH